MSVNYEALYFRSLSVMNVVTCSILVVGGVWVCLLTVFQKNKPLVHS